MTTYSTIWRYFTLVKMLEEGTYPSSKIIMENLGISRRTFLRDKESLWNEFDILIEYDRFKNGYYIDEEQTSDLDDSMKFFELSAMSGTFTEIIKERNNARKYIYFDTNEKLTGMEYFNKLLLAIKSHSIIDMSYKKFTDDNIKTYRIAPLFLKEYDKRWYVISRFLKYNSVVTFALDRIKGIELTKETYLEKHLDEIVESFKDIIGVSISDKGPEVIELSFTPEQGKYVKTLPWHESQTEIACKEDEYRIGLYVARNIELEKKILREGDQVKVIKPQWLKDILIERARGFIEKNS